MKHLCERPFYSTGKQEKNVDEKTIMLVGATGSGKSTLVDGIVNYVLGVRFNDPFRFTLVQLEEEEKKVDNQVFCIKVLYLLTVIHTFKQMLSKSAD